MYCAFVIPDAEAEQLPFEVLDTYYFQPAEAALHNILGNIEIWCGLHLKGYLVVIYGANDAE